MAKHALKKIPVRKPSEGGDIMAEEPSLFPPSFDVSVKQIPEIKNWKVGGKYRLVIEVEQKSARENRHKELNAGFDILAYKDITPPSDPKDMNDEEIAEYQAKNMPA